MRSNIADYNAVVEAASKFTRSVAEGNSKYSKELFTEDACLFGFLNGKLERGSIQQFYHNVDTVGAGEEFKTRIDVLELEETLAVVRVLEEIIDQCIVTAGERGTFFLEQHLLYVVLGGSVKLTCGRQSWTFRSRCGLQPRFRESHPFQPYLQTAIWLCPVAVVIFIFRQFST